MNQNSRRVGLRELVRAYVDARRNDGHEPLATYHSRVLSAFEAALGVVVPRPSDDLSSPAPLGILFRSTVDSLLSLRTPLSGFLEAGLIHRKLEEAGTDGAEVEKACLRMDEHVRELKEEHLLVLQRLLRIFIGRDPVVPWGKVAATGLHPGEPPAPDFESM